ncbi:MAG: flagellar type III secretion system pore protein FliP [Candidatus Rokubacteria bacterium]|nr:flagellar type III secretion system pore protein FliP [Candidatus Rokubacteria bacterium]MBI4593844.1 flagellar type III secretion system pore protein FliP [Candidatus Rokubacteria bacterium]
MIGQISLPGITFTAAGGPDQVTSVLEVVALLTVLTLAPSIVIMLTCFTRVLIVLSFLRQAIGVPQMPPNQIMTGLALFLTIFIMAPVGQEVHRTALGPYLQRQLKPEQALERGWAPVRAFLLKHTRERDLGLMVELSHQGRPARPDDVAAHALIPAFVVSELRTAFQLAFVLFVPFLVIDMVVASILMSMGMLMLPPVMISLPLKILLFVLADGWHLIVRSLVQSYQ